MKIAIFHELNFGGARRVVSEFSKRLSEFFEVDLYYVDAKEDKGIKKYVSKSFYYPFYPKKWKGNNWRIRLYKDTIELIDLYRLHKNIALDIQSRSYDYIFVHPSKFTQAPFLLRFLNNRCIYYCQEPLRIIYDPVASSNIRDIDFPRSLYEFLNRKIRKWIDLVNFKNASIVLTNSNFSKEFIEKSYGRKTTICYLGVDVNLFKPQNLEKTVDVLFIGNKDNGYELLKKVTEMFKGRIKTRTIFRENRSSITDAELAKVYNESKVLVALNYNEPFGLIPLEAMACGIPVVAVGEGGYNESIIDNKTGFLISRDTGELYKRIKEIINDDKLRQKMSKNARKNILLNWTWDESVGRFLKIINYEK